MIALAAFAGLTVAVCFVVGAAVAPRWSLPAAVAIGVIAQLIGGGPVNPLLVVVTFGPWAAGVVVRSRRRMASQLRIVGDQLESQRQLHTAEQVRLERIRLARELHDTVAHWLTGVVVQASAGQVLSGTDTRAAAEALGQIAEAARRAGQEVERALALATDAPAQIINGLEVIDGLVDGVVAAGVDVRATTAIAAGWPFEIAATAVRVVQEGITNALKHAPGATVEIRVHDNDDVLLVTVVNDPAQRPPSGLEASGSTLGLVGLRERAEAVGGLLEAGPTPGGGWRLTASLPRPSGR